MDNSVISKQQLDMLLNSMRDSVQKKKVIEAVKRTHKLNNLEKNAFYHGILEIARASQGNSQSSKDIAMATLEAVEQVLREKADAFIQSVDLMDDENPTASGGIFRRVG